MSQNIPQHIGLILDGNRRWAKAQGLPTLEGHHKGYEILKDLADYLIKKGVQYVSAYIFSTENWKRSKEEVAYLMDLALWVATEELEELNRRNIRVRFLGLKEGLRADIIKAIENAENSTAKNTAGTLALCFNYGGRAEIVAATREALQAGRRPDELDEADISAHLWAPDVPDMDLVLRTSGEQRLSNFMLWRAAYSEFYFFEKHWPAITPRDMDEALSWYATRERRFGGDAKPA